MTNLIRIPQRFLVDHMERDLPSRAGPLLRRHHDQQVGRLLTD